ncbi:hypothetical protein HPB50_016737 [Hyalomma asiaticum]|uniref:Uncharacterized protein n=1 Tax=Hyalomma asiaticum TaxID=266040 RepID=A0ACB7RXB8_HYAAI|nr:hypothetical protein HPB50_016737 [Hyalomma asiaticum]
MEVGRDMWKVTEVRSLPTSGSTFLWTPLSLRLHVVPLCRSTFLLIRETVAPPTHEKFGSLNSRSPCACTQDRARYDSIAVHFDTGYAAELRDILTSHPAFNHYLHLEQHWSDDFDLQKT